MKMSFRDVDEGTKMSINQRPGRTKIKRIKMEEMMEYIVILIAEICTVVILGILLNTRKRKIKVLVEDRRLDKIANNFPENKEICQEILKMLKNDHVTIKENEDKENKTSLYIAMTDTIWIASIRDSYTRIQTIAHECLHSIQNRKLLLFNFLFSNVYILYFLISVILTIIGVIRNYNLQIMILLMLSLIYYVVRSYLEMDAMTKARYVAEIYMERQIEENPRTNVSKEEVKELGQAYEKMNRIGIPATMFWILGNCFSKTILYTILVCIITMIFS